MLDRTIAKEVDDAAAVDEISAVAVEKEANRKRPAYVGRIAWNQRWDSAARIEVAYTECIAAPTPTEKTNARPRMRARIADVALASIVLG